MSSAVSGPVSLSTRRRAFDSGTFSCGKAHRFHPFPGPFCQNVCHWWKLPFIGLEVLASSVTLPLWKVIRDFQWSICFRFGGEDVTIGKGCVDTNSSLLLLFLGVPTSLRRGSSSWDLGGQWKSVYWKAGNICVQSEEWITESLVSVAQPHLPTELRFKTWLKKWP